MDGRLPAVHGWLTVVPGWVSLGTSPVVYPCCTGGSRTLSVSRPSWLLGGSCQLPAVCTTARQVKRCCFRHVAHSEGYLLTPVGRHVPEHINNIFNVLKCQRALYIRHLMSQTDNNVQLLIFSGRNHGSPYRYLQSDTDPHRTATCRTAGRDARRASNTVDHGQRPATHGVTAVGRPTE